MDYSVSLVEGPPVTLHLGGDFDLRSAGLALSVGRAGVDRAGPDALHVNCAEVRLADSSMLRALVALQAYAAERHARVVLVGVPPPLRRLISGTGLARSLVP